MALDQSMRAVPPFLKPFQKKAEAKRNTSFRDPLAGVWTNGYGHTGPDVGPNQNVDDATIDQWLELDDEAAVAKLYRVLKTETISHLSSNQWGALIDFVFNTGAGRDWQIWKRANLLDFSGVASELERFEYYHDLKGVAHISAGLKARRDAEIAMWKTPDPADVGLLNNPPPPATAVIDAHVAEGGQLANSAITRVTSTPPTPKPAPKGLLASIIGSGSGLLAIGPEALKGAADQVHNLMDWLSPYQEHSHYVGSAVSTLATFGAVLCGVAFVYGLIAQRSLKT
jgi:lysozyme